MPRLTLESLNKLAPAHDGVLPNTRMHNTQAHVLVHRHKCTSTCNLYNSIGK